MPDILWRSLSTLVENATQIFDIGDGVQTSTVWHWLRTMAFGDDLSEIAFMDANEVGSFGRGEQAYRLLGSRRKSPLLVRLQLSRQLIGVSHDLATKVRNDDVRLVKVCVYQNSAPDIRAYFDVHAKNALII